MVRELYGYSHSTCRGRMEKMKTTEEQLLKEIDRLKEQMILSIQELVQIKSVAGPKKEDAPYGEGPKAALLHTLKLAENLGFKTVNLDNQVGYAVYGDASDEDYIASVGHLDVVPEGDGWKYPPYSAKIEDGTMYGRGVLDNKGPIMTILFALAAIKNAGAKIKRPIRIVFGTDEETGKFRDIHHYLTQQKPPKYGFTPDCKYSVVYSERGRASVLLSVAKENAQFLFDFVNHYFIGANNTVDRLGIDYYNEAYGTIEMRGYDIQETEESFIFKFVLSYPAGNTIDEILEKITEKAEKEKVALKLLTNYEPVLFDKDSKMVKLLGETYEEITGLDGTPVTTTGGTYAKMMPNIVPFGPSFPGQKGIGHQPNEWMNIEDLITNAKIYTLALYRLSNL